MQYCNANVLARKISRLPEFQKKMQELEQFLYVDTILVQPLGLVHIDILGTVSLISSVIIVVFSYSKIYVSRHRQTDTSFCLVTHRSWGQWGPQNWYTAYFAVV